MLERAAIDEDTYAKAKPLFQAAIADLGNAKNDLKEAMRTVIRMVLDKFGVQVANNMKPYVVRFIEETGEQSKIKPRRQAMQALYKPNLYPREIQAKLKTMPPLAIEILNRWALGWPKAVKELVQAGQLLPALIEQEQKEREVLSNPGNNHLARHEIIQEYGLSMGPPSL